MASAQQFKGWLTDYMKQASVSVSRTTAKNYGRLAQKLHELSASPSFPLQKSINI